MIRAALIAAMLATPAAAQTALTCFPREAVMVRLAEAFGETLQSIGLGNGGAVVETFANLQTGTWTITVTTTEGITCLIGSGQAFERVSEALPPGGDRL